ncbi:MAG: hypothetical protein WDA71_13415 [Actinomycetota bacterium]
MMAIPVQSRPLRQYLGNRNTKEVHDLRNEQPKCQISDILRAGHGVVFQPDTLAQARSEGYDNCAWCVGGSSR